MRTLTRLGQTVGRVSEVNRLHRTRLTAKRIRYVIEPLPHQLPGVRDATNRLKRLQALLGEIRDLQTLRQSMARYARSDTLLKRQDIQAASRIVRNEEERLFRTFLHRRERGEIARLGQRLSSLVERLRQ